MADDLKKRGNLILKAKKTVVCASICPKNEKATVHRCDQESPA